MALDLDVLKRLDRRKIVAKLDAFGAFAEFGFVDDAVVGCWKARRLLRRYGAIGGFFWYSRSISSNSALSSSSRPSTSGGRRMNCGSATSRASCSE